MNNTLIVNLLGQPGAGKSTGAAYIIAMLQMAGVSAEYIQEFAKDKVWEENTTVFGAQEYIFGKQSYRLRRCTGKVDVVVTDCPLLLSAFYNEDNVLGVQFNNMVFDRFNSYENMNFLLTRVKPYNPAGRHQNEDEATIVAANMLTFLTENYVDFTTLPGTKDSYDSIVEEVLARLGHPDSITTISEKRMLEDENKNLCWALWQVLSKLSESIDCSEEHSPFCTGDHCANCCRDRNARNSLVDGLNLRCEYTSLHDPVAFEPELYKTMRPLTRRLLTMCACRGITEVGIDTCPDGLFKHYHLSANSLYAGALDAQKDNIIFSVARDMGIYGGAANGPRVQIKYTAARALDYGVYTHINGMWHKK